MALPTLAVPDLPIGRLAAVGAADADHFHHRYGADRGHDALVRSDSSQPPDVDRDFIGVGAGSILAGLIGGFPVDASPPRTAVVSETGGRSQLAGLVAAAIVLVLLAFGTSLLRHVPQAALAGVLLFVALRIIRVGQII